MDLIGRSIISSEGISIGIVQDAYLDQKTGEPVSLLIEPTSDINQKIYQKDELGKIVIPYDGVSKVRNILIFEKIETSH